MYVWVSCGSCVVCKSRMEITVRITEITVIFSDLKNGEIL